jgi:chromosome partitioning protein
MDVWATEPTLALAKAEGRPMLLVLNRVPSRTRLADALAGAIEGLGVPVAATQLGNRTGYAAAMMDGLGVSEGGRNKAADEIMALAREVLG